LPPSYLRLRCSYSIRKCWHGRIAWLHLNCISMLLLVMHALTPYLATLQRQRLDGAGA
jgi:hypothetical protein